MDLNHYYTLAPALGWGEDIVHAGGNTRSNMNKAWVAEAVHGSIFILN